MDSTRFHAPANCLGQTCLTWQRDGEQCPGDRQLVQERLLQMDGCAAGSKECWLISEGWASEPSRGRWHLRASQKRKSPPSAQL